MNICHVGRPELEAVNAWEPTVRPSCHDPLLAMPWESVTDVPPTREPPPLSTANTTVMPGTGRSFASRTDTDGPGINEPAGADAGRFGHTTVIATGRPTVVFEIGTGSFPQARRALRAMATNGKQAELFKRFGMVTMNLEAKLALD